MPPLALRTLQCPLVRTLERWSTRPHQNPFGRCDGCSQPLIPNRDNAAVLDEYLLARCRRSPEWPVAKFLNYYNRSTVTPRRNSASW